jgi:hypothetical protein
MLCINYFLAKAKKEKIKAIMGKRINGANNARLSDPGRGAKYTTTKDIKVIKMPNSDAYV